MRGNNNSQKPRCWSELEIELYNTMLNEYRAVRESTLNQIDSDYSYKD